MEAEIAALKAQEVTLRLQLQEEQLAYEKAELERARAELARERDALDREAAAPPVTPRAAEPAPGKPRPRPAGPARPALAAAAGGHDFQMFFERLAPYGHWMETAEYGHVWRRASTRQDGWRPYTLGRWVDSDHGWAWVSDEPFGWATYHYGRWALLEHHGWIWVPGDTWAPAWVAWRSNADCVGWAPLPPETVYAGATSYGPEVDDDYGLSAEWYTFLPVRHFDGPVASHCRPASENRHFFSLTVGITHVVIRSDSVLCEGPEPRWVNSCLPRPMPRHGLERKREWNGRRDYRPQIENNRLSCYAPQVRTAWNDGLRPSRTQGHLNDVKVVRRHDSFRGEYGRRYHQEQQERRQRAVVALQEGPVQRLAARHQDLEKIRVQRAQLIEDRPSRPGRSEPATNTRPLPDRAANAGRDRQTGNDREHQETKDEQSPSPPRGEAIGTVNEPPRPEPPAKEREAQARLAQDRETNNRREVAERQQAAQSKEREAQSRRVLERETNNRREVAERQQASQAKEREDQSRRVLESETNNRREAAERRQQEQAARARSEKADDSQGREKK